MNFPPQVLEYFANHSISDAVVKEWQLSWNGQRLVIPIFDKNGETIFNKLRRNPASEEGPKYIFEKGGYMALYGIHKIKNESVVVVTEGETCALTLWSQGIPAITSTGGALAFRSEWAEILKEKEVYLAFDNDSAGGRGAAKTLTALPEAKVVLLPEFEGVKDVSDYIAKGYDFKKLMQGAKAFKDREAVIEDRAIRRGAGENIYFHEAWLAAWEAQQWDGGRPLPLAKGNGDRITRAKAVPIGSIVKVNREKKTLCLWHHDQHPSMHIYPNNKGFCFSCSKSADVIDFVQEVKGLTLTEALDFLAPR